MRRNAILAIFMSMLAVLVPAVDPLRVQATQIGDLAATLNPGSWGKLPDPPAHFFRDPFAKSTCQSTNLAFAGKGVWSETYQRVYILGAGHICDSKLHVYDDSTNSWLEGGRIGGGRGHAYNHNAIRESANRLAFIDVNSNAYRFYEFPLKSSVNVLNPWIRYNDFPNNGGIVSAMTYWANEAKFAIADGTFGDLKLVTVSGGSLSAADVERKQSCFSDGRNGLNSTFMLELNDGRIAYGGGSTSAGEKYFSHKWCTKVAGQPSVQMPNSPSSGPSLRIPEGGNPTEGGIITVDPASGDMLVLGANGRMWRFNFGSNSWSDITSGSQPPPFSASASAVSNSFVVPITGYNVLMVCKAFSQTSSSCWIYKHNGAPGVVDTIDPTVPTGVSATAISDTHVSISFTPSTDNVGVGGYRVERDGGTATITGSSSPITVGGLQGSTLYSFKVKAIDTSGNESAYSSPGVTVTTLAGATPPAITTPTPGSTLTSNGMNIAWQNNGTTVTDYWIHVGSAQEEFDYLDSGALGAGTTSYAVGGLPIDGSPVWVRLWYQTSSGWFEIDYEYTAFTGVPDTQDPTVPSALQATGTSSSAITLTFGASSDDVGVARYDVYRFGALVGSTVTTTYVDSGLSALSSYSYRVRAVDGSGNQSGQSNESSAQTLAAGAGEPNTMTLRNTSGSTMTARPFSTGRMFRRGEFTSCTAASIGGVPVTTQTNVQNRWADGSTQFAIISFIIPSLAVGETKTVELTSSSTCNDGASLTQSQMLASGFNFGATITMNGANTQTANARTMLSNGDWRVWISGSVVTAVIIEDRTPARSYDRGFFGCSGETCPLHPIFEAWFYPGTNDVNVGYAMENIWASSDASKSAEDNTYSATLSAGNTSSVTKLSHPSFTHIGLTRWHRKYWIGAEKGSLHIDHNRAYLIRTGLIPHYGGDVTISSSLASNYASTYSNNSGTFNRGGGGNSLFVGSYRPASLNVAGTNTWKHYFKSWESAWLYSQREDLYEAVIGNADQIGRAPVYAREADVLAGVGDYFDQEWNDASSLSSIGSKNGTGVIGTFGRPLSINARPTVYYSDGPASGSSEDDIDYGSLSNDGWPGGANNDSSHFSDGCSLAYLLTGRYYYMECVQLEAGWRAAWKISAWGGSYQRPGYRWGLYNSNLRTDAWMLKVINMAAVVSPDGTPEEAYFVDKIKDSIAGQEGLYDLDLTYPEKIEHWRHGRLHRSHNCSLTNVCLQGPYGPSPLGLMWVGGSTSHYNESYVDSNLIDGTNSPWTANQVIFVYGMVKQTGIGDPSNLMKYWSRIRFMWVKDEACHSPQVGEEYAHAESYRWPTVITATGQWAANCEEIVSGFQYSPSAAGGLAANFSTVFGYRDNGPALSEMDDSKLMQMVAAYSVLTEYTSVDGYNGQEVWDLFTAQAPNHYDSGTGRCGSHGSRWCVTPFDSGGAIVVPPDPPEIFPLQLFDRPLLPLNPLGGL